MSMQNGNRIVDGVDIATVGYMRSGESELSAFYVMGEYNSPLETLALVVTGDPCMYFINTLDLSSESNYNITGQCNPPGLTVYLSSGYEENSVPSLLNNTLTWTNSDADGHFTFANISGHDGKIVVWIRVEPNDAQAAGIVCTSVSTGLDATGKAVVYQTFVASDQAVCPICGGTGDNQNTDGADDCGNCNKTGVVTVLEPNHKIDGTSSTNIDTVYLSLCDTGTADDFLFDNLKNNLITSSPVSDMIQCSRCDGNKTLSDGSVCPDCDGEGSVPRKDGRGYSMSNMCMVGSTYAVWGLIPEGETGSITISEVTITNAQVCLSGDTIILMNDGSEQRLDSLIVGDMVMSEDHTPTQVIALARGRFNPHHTLYHFEDGTVIDETHTHRFYNIDQGFWQRLSSWRIGDHAVSQNGNRIALTAVEHVAESAEMFGVWTESGSYYANGLLSGDASCNKDLLADATTEQAIDMMLSIEEQKLYKLMGMEGILP